MNMLTLEYIGKEKEHRRLKKAEEFRRLKEIDSKANSGKTFIRNIIGFFVIAGKNLGKVCQSTIESNLISTKGFLSKN